MTEEYHELLNNSSFTLLSVNKCGQGTATMLQSVVRIKNEAYTAKILIRFLSKNKSLTKITIIPVNKIDELCWNMLNRKYSENSMNKLLNTAYKYCHAIIKKEAIPVPDNGARLYMITGLRSLTAAG